MQYWESWLSITIVSLLASMVPGLSFALVLRNTLSFSRSTGIFTALGLAVGMSFYVLIVIFGLAVIILDNVWLSKSLALVGACYLIYVGIKCLFAKKRIFDAEKQETIISSQNKLTKSKAFIMGCVTTIFNPKIMLFFLALFTQFIKPNTPWQITLGYGATCAIVEFLWFSSVAILLTHTQLQKKFYAITHWLERGSGVVLLLISFRLILSQFLGA